MPTFTDDITGGGVWALLAVLLIVLLVVRSRKRSSKPSREQSRDDTKTVKYGIATAQMLFGCASATYALVTHLQRGLALLLFGLMMVQTMSLAAYLWQAIARVWIATAATYMLCVSLALTATLNTYLAGQKNEQHGFSDTTRQIQQLSVAVSTVLAYVAAVIVLCVGLGLMVRRIVRVVRNRTASATAPASPAAPPPPPAPAPAPAPASPPTGSRSRGGRTTAPQHTSGQPRKRKPRTR